MLSIYRVDGMKKMILEAQGQTARLQTNLDYAQKEIIEVQAKADAQKASLDWYVDDDAKAWNYGKEKALEAHNNAKQRDVLIYVFAISIALYALQGAGFIIPPESGWFAIAAKATVFFLAFGAAYAFGRFALAWLAGFIP